MEARLAHPSEADGLLPLINRAFEVERFFIDAERLDRAELLQRFTTGVFLVLDDGTLAACVYLELSGSRAYLGLLSVDPSRKRQGLGSKMMAAAEAYCRRQGCHQIDLTVVNLRQELPPFYRHHGFTETGTAPFPDHPALKVACHFIQMSKQL